MKKVGSHWLISCFEFGFLRKEYHITSYSFLFEFRILFRDQLS